MVHLPIHLVRQVKLCGPVANAWCYPVERHLNVLKKYIRSRAHPEGAIANAYMYDEALGFCTEYLKMYPHTRRRIWDDEEELGDCGELLEGKAVHRELSTLGSLKIQKLLKSPACKLYVPCLCENARHALCPHMYQTKMHVTVHTNTH